MPDTEDSSRARRGELNEIRELLERLYVDPWPPADSEDVLGKLRRCGIGTTGRWYLVIFLFFPSLILMLVPLPLAPGFRDKNLLINWSLNTLLFAVLGWALGFGSLYFLILFGVLANAFAAWLYLKYREWKHSSLCDIR